MKKIILLIIVSFGIVAIAFSQNKPNKQGFNRNNIEALKVAYITRQLNLTTEEAQKFWPVHNIYFEELKKARKDNLDNELAFEEKALSVRKKYSVEFKKVLISDERVNKVFTSDRDFNNELRKELKNRMMNNPNFKKRIEQDPSSSKND
jgi:hypothetical protein